jgi:hypothetical protein
MPWKVALVGADDVVYGASRTQATAEQIVQRLNKGQYEDDAD